MLYNKDMERPSGFAGDIEHHTVANAADIRVALQNFENIPGYERAKNIGGQVLSLTFLDDQSDEAAQGIEISVSHVWRSPDGRVVRASGQTPYGTSASIHFSKNTYGKDGVDDEQALLDFVNPTPKQL